MTGSSFPLSSSSLRDSRRELTIRSLRGGGDTVVVAVIDRGKGISPEDTSRMFEAFYTTREGGMGMGLAICRSIIRAHDGKLSARNNPDGGATFQFELPSVGGGAS